MEALSALRLDVSPSAWPRPPFWALALPAVGTLPSAAAGPNPLPLPVVTSAGTVCWPQPSSSGLGAGVLLTSLLFQNVYLFVGPCQL